MNKILTLLGVLGAMALGVVVFNSAPTSQIFGAFGATWQATSTTQGWIFPSKMSGTEQTVVSKNFIATSTTATSTFAGDVVIDNGGTGTSTISIGEADTPGCTEFWDTSNAAYSHFWTDAGVLYVDTGQCI